VKYIQKCFISVTMGVEIFAACLASSQLAVYGIVIIKHLVSNKKIEQEKNNKQD